MMMANSPAALPSGKCPGGHGHYCESIEDQRSRIIGEAFPFEDYQDSLGSCILRAMPRARRRPAAKLSTQDKPHGQDSQEPVRGRGGSHGREHDTADGKQGNRTQTEAKSRQLIATADE